MTFSLILRRLPQLPRSASTEDGQAVVEYALLLSLIALAGFVAVEAFGGGVHTLFVQINSGVQAGIH